MRWTIFSVDPPRLAFARAGIELYRERLQKRGRFRFVVLRGRHREDREAKYLAASSAGLRVVLDERGEQWSSRELAARLREWQVRSVSVVHLLVGGAEGHSDGLRDRAGHLWSLSRATIQHELALVLALEQIYRAHTMLSGEPYHRD